MFVKIALYISKFSFIKKNIILKKIFKTLAKIFARVIYGKYKKISIANNYTFLIDSNFAFSNFDRDGITKNLYSKSTNDFDTRDSYQWRFTMQWEPTENSTLTLLHNAYDEESRRVQVSGNFCDTASSMVQGLSLIHI